MVIASFTATESEERKANEDIVKHADFMVNSLLGDSAAALGTSKEFEIKVDSLKADLKKYKDIGDIVSLYKLTEKSIKMSKSFIADKKLSANDPAEKSFIDKVANTETALKSLKSPAIFLDKMGILYKGLTLILTIAVLLFVMNQYTEKTEKKDKVVFLKKMVVYEALTVGVCVVLFPFFWMLCTAFKPSGQELVINTSNPFDIVTTTPTLNNFRRVLKIDDKAMANKSVDPIENKKHFGTYFMNSLLVSTTAAFLVTLFASMGAYVFSKKNLPHKDTIFKVLLMSMMIPGMMFMVPQFFMICKMGLFGTKWAMFLPHLASVFGIHCWKLLK
jgi:ABC-type maltose transport system permease subunit